MSRLEYWQKKIQEKRKQTPWRQFVKEICSRKPIILHKDNDKKVSRYPETSRKPHIDITDLNTSRIGEIEQKNGFFGKIQHLLGTIPTPGLLAFGENENSNYADLVVNAKNSYLSYTVTESENVIYSFNVKENSHNVLNSLSIFDNSENIYYSNGVINGYGIYFSSNIESSNNIWYSTNLRGCKECVGCDHLDNMEYCIGNVKYNKELYYDLKSEYLKARSIDQTQPTKIDSINLHCDNIENGDYNYCVRNGRNILMIGAHDYSSDIYDSFLGGIGGCNQIYGVQGFGYGNQTYCSIEIGRSYEIYYSYYLDNCSYCLGCIGLKNKSFCIFNKQYEKEERFEKADEIFAQMEKEGTLGDFFPGRMNPFYFNDTAAYLIDDSFRKEEVEAAGYLWRDEEIKVDIPDRMEVVKVEELDQYEGYDGDGKWYIDPTILKKVIQDEEGNVYRVIKMEYDFLVKHGLPLPRKHWLERLKGHFKIDGNQTRE